MDSKTVTPFASLIQDAARLADQTDRGFSLTMEVGKGKDSCRKTVSVDPSFASAQGRQE
ncbi:hypothetical protein [Neotabrizicola sp. VNH66]|uniref:hypothetical protein n=1 Tax=Neotabrizicola sp. VNH66 TaxID=3400918 RepID=UPI003C2B4868